MTSLANVAIGMMLLAVSLATGHTDYHLINGASFLTGAALVIVGTGAYAVPRTLNCARCSQVGGRIGRAGALIPRSPPSRLIGRE